MSSTEVLARNASCSAARFKRASWVYRWTLRPNKAENCRWKWNFEKAATSLSASTLRSPARWYELATKNDFANLIDLQKVFPSADWVDGRLVFNLGAHRLICGVSFLRKTLFFKALLSHAQYDQGGWKQ